VTPLDRCSVVSARVGEPLAATAPLARAWLILEQPGPYGRVALTDSHLPAEVGAAVARATEGTRTQVLLARTPGHHPDDRGHGATARRFWFAHTSAGGVRMRSGVVEDDVLLRPDLPDVLRGASEGQLPPWGARDERPLLLVCTNARRDRCCAIEGLVLADGLAERLAGGPHADRVLEVNHLGGHRFAPTALLLPAGVAYGRLDVDTAAAVLQAAEHGRLAALDRVRGRTAAPPPAQAAGLAVRISEGVDGIDDIDVLRRAGDRWAPVPMSFAPENGETELQVRHRDGRAWTVLVRRETVAPHRAESCGKDAVAAVGWVASAPVPAPAWS
jgi:hypothetical protein